VVFIEGGGDGGEEQGDGSPQHCQREEALPVGHNKKKKKKKKKKRKKKKNLKAQRR
jgi:hypothetical protein